MFHATIPLLRRAGPTTLIMRVVVHSLLILLGVVYYLDE